MEKKYPYVAIIEEYYKTSNGNFLCREKDQDINTHPYDWPIFVPEEFTYQIKSLPIYGILYKESHQAFRGGERITCYIVSHHKEELENIINPVLNEEDKARVERFWNEARNKS